MHRTTLKPFRALWTLLLGLAVSGPSLAQQPADKPPAGRTSSMVVSLNATQRVQMTTKKKIAAVDNPRPTIVRALPDPFDPTSVLITGLEAGISRIGLTDENKVVEEVVVTVQQFDVEYLRQILRQAVPTANVVPLPIANNRLVLTGTVARAEDVDTVMRLTASVVGDGAPGANVISAIRVGGVMQVQLEVVVAGVSRSEIRRLSFEFINNGQRHILSNGMGALTLPSGGITGTFPGGPQILNAISSVQGAPANIFLGVFDPRQDFFSFLQALRDENLVKLQTFPKVVVMSGRQVRFTSGGEQAIPQPGGLGTISVEFRPFGTTLNALPIVMGNGKIHLELEPEISRLNAAFGTSIGGTIVPGRTLQTIRTTVELESGQTLCLAGLIENNITGATRKIPILGDLPFVGTAFSQKQYSEDETELVILVTPRLVDPMSCDQLSSLPGSETRSPDDFELFLEGILEAPRGPRDLFPNRRYRAAHLTGPTAGMYPCVDPTNPSHGGHGHHGKGRVVLDGACATPRLGLAPVTAGLPHSGQPLPTAVLENRPATVLEPKPLERPNVLPEPTDDGRRTSFGELPPAGTSGTEPQPAVTPPPLPDVNSDGRR